MVCITLFLCTAVDIIYTQIFSTFWKFRVVYIASSDFEFQSLAWRFIFETSLCFELAIRTTVFQKTKILMYKLHLPYYISLKDRLHLKGVDFLKQLSWGKRLIALKNYKVIDPHWDKLSKYFQLE